MIEDKELLKIIGGSSSISGTLLSACSNLMRTIYAIGQGFGSSIRRIVTGNVCPV